MQSRERFTKAVKTRLSQKTILQWHLGLPPGHFGATSILHKKTNFKAANKNRFQKLYVGGEDRDAGSLLTLSGEPLSPWTPEVEKIGTDRMAKIYARNLFDGPALEA